ncbi:MAG: trypsin-like serine peptidase [Nevskiales bacterium]
MLKQLRHWIVLALFGVNGFAVAALPPGLQNLTGELQVVPQIILPSLDGAALKARLAQNSGQPQPLIIAESILTELLPAAGKWEPLNSGDWVWRLRLSSRQAKSLHLRFEDLTLPADAQLFVYSPGGADVRGPYTAADLTSERKLWTPIVRGEELVIELVTPSATKEQVGFRITNVYFGFEEFWKQEEAPFKEGNCHIDVVCAAAAPYANEVRAVGRITFDIAGGILGIGATTGLCSGQLLNNTASDNRQYFLTANHCISSAGGASSVVAYWNYQKSTCGGANDGSQNDTQVGGTTLRATSGGSDFTLLEFIRPLNSASNLFFSGWDRSEAPAGSAFTIHHPDGTEKRISFENNPLQITSFSGTTSPGDGNALRVVDWDMGSTEPGSSGAGLWNAQHRVVGQLSQGRSACGNDESDWYGRFARSWTGGGTSGSRLSNWLDPGNTGATLADGKNLSGSSVVIPPPQAAVDDDSGGGGCAIAGAQQPGNSLAALLAVALLGFWRRRWLKASAPDTRSSFRIR